MMIRGVLCNHGDVRWEASEEARNLLQWRSSQWADRYWVLFSVLAPTQSGMKLIQIIFINE